MHILGIMGDRNHFASRNLGSALFDQIVDTIELMNVLLGVLREADLTPRQRAAIQHWEQALPKLREGVKLARKSRTAPRKSRRAAPAKTQLR